MENLSVFIITLLSSSDMTATLLKIQFTIEKYGCKMKQSKPNCLEREYNFNIVQNATCG